MYQSKCPDETLRMDLNVRFAHVRKHIFAGRGPYCLFLFSQNVVVDILFNPFIPTYQDRVFCILCSCKTTLLAILCLTDIPVSYECKWIGSIHLILSSLSFWSELFHLCIWTCHCRLNEPGRHMTLKQRRLNIDATSWRCIDVEATLYLRHVPAGNSPNLYIRKV